MNFLGFSSEIFDRLATKKEKKIEFSLENIFQFFLPFPNVREILNVDEHETEQFSNDVLIAAHDVELFLSSSQNVFSRNSNRPSFLLRTKSKNKEMKIDDFLLVFFSVSKYFLD